MPLYRRRRSFSEETGMTQSFNFRELRSLLTAGTQHSPGTHGRRATRSRWTQSQDATSTRAVQQGMVPVLSPARGWEPSMGNAARPANSSTGPCLCSSHHLIIQPALKGNETSQWDPSLPLRNLKIKEPLLQFWWSVRENSCCYSY